MRHIISILLQNEAGALARVANMFAARGYNIDSLSVAPTYDKTVSRLTLVTNGSDQVVNQIVQQTRKLIDVVEIEDIAASDYLESELVMLKVEPRTSAARGVVDCARRHKALILDESESTRTLQLAGTSVEIDAFISDLGKVTTVLEVVRSGLAALSRGHRVMSLPK